MPDQGTKPVGVPQDLRHPLLKPDHDFCFAYCFLILLHTSGLSLYVYIHLVGPWARVSEVLNYLNEKSILDTTYTRSYIPTLPSFLASIVSFPSSRYTSKVTPCSLKLSYDPSLHFFSQFLFLVYLVAYMVYYTQLAFCAKSYC